MGLTRTTAAAGTTALIAGLLVTTAAPASADHPVVIKVTEKQTSYSATFSDDEIPERGDSYRFTGDLLKRGKVVGTEKGRCVLKRIIKGGQDDVVQEGEPFAFVIRCNGTLAFEKGDIRVKGTDTVDTTKDADLLTFPIVGGTGEYAGAEGTLRSRQITQKKAKFTLSFTAND